MVALEATPALVAEGTIRPGRLVKIGAADNSALEADANEECIGIADLSARAFDDANHALSGDPVRLQPERTKRLEFAGTVAVGARFKSDADGAGVAVATTGTVTQVSPGIALEAGADTKVSRIQWEPVQFDPEPT